MAPPADPISPRSGYRKAWTFSRVVEPWWTRPSHVLLPGGTALLVALVCAHLLPARYRASASVQVEWAADEVEALRRAGADVTNRGLEAARKRVLDPRLLERVLREVGDDQGTSGRPAPRGMAVEALAAALGVRARGANEALVLFEHGDPVRAALVANRLATRLVEETEAEHARRVEADPALIEGRLAEARVRMDAAALALLRRQGGLRAGNGKPVEPPPAPRETLQAERATVAAALSAARARAERLRQAVGVETRPPEPDGAASAELARLRAERVDLLRKYTEEHPDVVAVNDRIRRIEGERAARTPAPGPSLEALQAELGQVVREIQILERRAAELVAETDRSTGPRTTASPTIASRPRELEPLIQDYERAAAAYRTIEEQWRAAEAAWRLRPVTGPRFRMLREAGVPAAPQFPDRLHFGLIGLAIGLALGVALAVRAERRDLTVKGPEDLEELLPEPLLAEIPLIRLSRIKGRR